MDFATHARDQDGVLSCQLHLGTEQLVQHLQSEPVDGRTLSFSHFDSQT